MYHPVEGIGNGEGHAYVGHREYMRNPVPSSQFCSKPKTALKKKSQSYHKIKFKNYYKIKF